MSIKKILEPIDIGSCTIPNRIVFTAHATNFGRGCVSDKMIAYHEARARGGVGLLVVEILSVHSTSPNSLSVLDKNLVPSYQKLMKAIRPYGTKVFQQIWHGGSHAVTLDGSPPWAPSDIPSVHERVVPHPMTFDQIDEIIEAYANAARLCEEGGLDGVELHGAHGYLIQQFMSPLTNRRADQYGGSFDNRFRFTLEVLKAVRKAVSKDFVVGIRLSHEATPGGLDSGDNIRIVQKLEADQLVDYISISMGGYFAFPKMIGGMHEPVGYEIPTSAPVAGATSLPSIVVGRVRTLEEAGQMIADGLADLVGMTRAHIADPDLIFKTRDGRRDQVRPCIACNQGCVGELFGPQRRMACVVNPVVGKEQNLREDLLIKVKNPKKVLVIGGGPAGLEASRIAALRGHKVILMEAQNRLGGTVSLARMVPHLHCIYDFIHWQISEIDRLGVKVLTNTYVEAAEVNQAAPDAVIIATGSFPRMDGIQLASPGEPTKGLDCKHVLSPIDLLSSPGIIPGKNAVVFDDVGHYEAVGIAEYLMEKGLSVTFVTSLSEFAPLMKPALRSRPALERLVKGDFHLMTNARLCKVAEKEVEVTFLYGGDPRFIAADIVIPVFHNRSECSLKDELNEFSGNILVAGDAGSPRHLKGAIHDGFRAGSMV